MKFKIRRDALSEKIVPENSRVESVHSDVFEIVVEAQSALDEVWPFGFSNGIDGIRSRLLSLCEQASLEGRSSNVAKELFETRKMVASELLAIRSNLIRRLFVVWGCSMGLALVSIFSWWILRKYQVWLFLPETPEKIVNILVESLGWVGYSLFGFSLAWLLFQCGKCRTAEYSVLRSVRGEVSSIPLTLMHFFWYNSLAYGILFFIVGVFSESNPLHDILGGPPSGVWIGIVLAFLEKSFLKKAGERLGFI